MAGLDAARLEGLVDGMLVGGRLDPMTFGSMMRTFVGDCAEAYVAAAAAVARALACGPVDLGGGSSAHPLPTGSGHELGMGFRHGGERFVAVVEMSGKPDPEFDALMEKVFEDMGVPRVEGGEPAPSLPRGMRVARAGRDEAATLAALVADRWIPELVLEVGVSHGSARDDDEPVSADDEWLRGSRDLQDQCAWADSLQVLDMAVVATGNEGILLEACRAMGTRRWAVQDGFPPTVAGAALALDCGFRPGRRGVALVEAIQARACEIDMSKCRDMLLGLRDTCSRHGHVGEDDAYDLGTDAYAFTLADDGPAWVVRLDTQARDIAAVLRFDPRGEPVAMEVHQRTSAPRGTAWGADAFGMPSGPRGRAGAPESLVASFEVSGGAFRAVASPGNDADRIRAWNGFEANVHNAHLSFEAEYGRAPAP